MSGAERSRRKQFRSLNRRIVFGRKRIGGEVGAVIDLAGLLRRQEVVLEFENLRRTARGVAGGRVDWNTFEIIAGAIDEIAALVELEVAAAGVTIDALEQRRALRERGR